MKKVLTLGLITVLIFGGGGWYLIEYVQDRSFLQLWQAGMPWEAQLGIGSAYGLLTAAAAIGIIRLPFFRKERKFYHRVISQLDLNVPLIIFLSLCAGLGEEIFFRAGLQPLLGLWLTSVLFVFIHGYLNPRNWRISVYGVAMVLFIAGMGYLFEEVGLLSAIAAHTVLDIVLFLRLTRGQPRQ